MTPLLIVGIVFVALAALFHVYIFTLESLTWTSARTRKTFGIHSTEEAETTRALAFNQGFYNLFLAIGAAVGLVLLGVNSSAAVALIVLAAGSMVLAGLVLILSSKELRRSGLIQATPPLIGIVFVLLAFAV
jgi:putative membrane protein